MLIILRSYGAQNSVVACTVHEPPEAPIDAADRAERLVFVEDGFNWFAFLLAPVWMLVHRLWLPLLAYLVVAVAMGFVLGLIGIGPVWAFLASLALNLAVAFEADSIERWTLARKGWRIVGTVNGATTRDCERRYFERYAAEAPVAPHPSSVTG